MHRCKETAATPGAAWSKSSRMRRQRVVKIQESTLKDIQLSRDLWIRKKWWWDSTNGEIPFCGEPFELLVVWSQGEGEKIRGQGSNHELYEVSYMVATIRLLFFWVSGQVCVPIWIFEKLHAHQVCSQAQQYHAHIYSWSFASCSWCKWRFMCAPMDWKLALQLNWKSVPTHVCIGLPGHGRGSDVPVGGVVNLVMTP
jgi:hypothetical protein